MANKKDVQVCWLLGNYHQRADVIKKIKDTLNNPYVVIYDDNEVSLDFLALDIKQQCFFDEKKLTILNGWPSFSGSKEKYTKIFLDMIKNIGASNVLVLNNLENSHKKIFDNIEQEGKVFNFDLTIPQKACQHFINAIVKEYDKEIESEAITALLSCFGLESSSIDIDRLYLSIKSVSDYIGNRKTIKKEDILKVCSDSSEFVVWSLYASLDKKNIKSAIEIVSKYLQSQTDEVKSIDLLISQFAWRYKLILLVREGLSQNLVEEKIIENIKELIKLETEGSGFETRFKIDGEKSSQIYSDKMIQSVLKGNYYSKPVVDNYTRGELYRIVLALQILSMEIRKGLSEKIAKLFFNTLLMLICGKINYSEFKIIIGEKYVK